MTFKKRIEDYWNGEAKFYSDSINRELNNLKGEAWIKLIMENAPEKQNMKVLDIGTGPGFFAIIVAKMGHDATGIDCTENMISFAATNAEKEGVSPKFIKMDCHKLDFSEESFDLIICRNLTWILTEPEMAYAEWYRVLKKGGRLLIFDANWNLHLTDEKMRKLHEEDYRNYEEMGYGKPPHHVNVKEGKEISAQLPFSSKFRPEWDFKALKNCGFSKIFSKDISNVVYDEKEKILHKSVPMFMICAEKQQ